jgi:ribosomal protein L12E/L44/L45/RPP1/RPP2
MILCEPLLPLAETSAVAGAGASSPEVASQESEEEGSEEEDSAEDDSAEEGGEEEGRLLGSLLEVAGSLLAGE